MLEIMSFNSRRKRHWCPVMQSPIARILRSGGKKKPIRQAALERAKNEVASTKSRNGPFHPLALLLCESFSKRLRDELHLQNVLFIRQKVGRTTICSWTVLTNSTLPDRT